MLNSKAKPQNELKYKHYGADNMLKALEAVRMGKISQRQACKAFTVRRGALQNQLQNQLHGKVADDARIEGQTVLTAAEDALEEYIILMTEIGYPLTTKQLKIEVQAIMKKDGQKNPFTDETGWLHGFLKWHP